MKKQKTTNILLMILVCVILSACGQEKVTSDTEEPDSTVGVESHEGDQVREIEIIPAEKADIPEMANESGRALTAEELQLFDEFVDTADEKLFVLRVAAENFGYENDGYHDMRYELVLEKNGETYQFRSNRLMLEEGLIEDQSFQVSLSPIGDVIFASYGPNMEEIPLADVSFSIIKDGWEITQLHGAEYSINIRETDVFNEIEEVAFADYDEDGITDIIMILNYSPVSDADASYSEVRVYKGEYQDYSYWDYYYFQRCQTEISETLTAELSEKTISAVLDYLATVLPDTTAN